VAEIILA